MTRALACLTAALLFVAVYTVTHRSAAGPSRVLQPAVAAVQVGASPSPARAVPTTLSRRSHLHRPHNVCGGGETSPGVGLPSQNHGSSLVTCRLRRLDITSYCETGNRTASGVWPRYGMAASNLFPFGTRLRVPGWPVVVTVTDRVGWGSDLDLYATSCSGAIKWGRRSLLVEVLRGR